MTYKEQRNAFRPIRRYYRAKVGALLPQFPTVRADGCGELTVDWSFLERIADATPSKYLEDLKLRIEAVNQNAPKVFPPPSEVEPYYGTPLPSAARLINELLAQHDLARKRMRLATFSDLLKHELGIIQCFLPYED